MKRRSTGLVTVLAMIWGTALVIVSVPTAAALPGGAWAKQSAPLNNSYRGTAAGASYGRWQGYRENQGRGSRIQDWSAHRQRNAPEIASRGSYVRHGWYFNANRCYLTSSSTAGCSAGWWSSGSSKTPSTRSKSWQYYETWKRVDPQGESGRGKMQTCEDLSQWPDNCSQAYFLRGSSY